jgi:hypothetical protein
MVEGFKGGFMRKPTIWFVTILIVITVSASLVETSPGDPLQLLTCGINSFGDSYVAYLDMKINYFGDYGVLAAFFTERGVEAYGIVLLKYPGEKPSLYAMVGDQNYWFYLSNITTGGLNISIVVDLTYRVVKITFSNTSKYFDLSSFFIPRLFTVIAGNVTGRYSLLPNVTIVRYGVYVSNTSLLNAQDPSRPPTSNIVVACGEVTPIQNQTTATTEVWTTTSRVNSGNIVLPKWILLAALVIVALVAVSFMLFISGKIGSP